ncbi:MAG: hypothetical protein Q7S27_02325 [Nanoarchaeota archaeon]|nr:hypothetical protein [Nanoarchaeota archaeon]
MAEVTSYLGPTIIILAGSLVTLIVIIMALTMKNKKLKKEVIEKKVTIEHEELIRGDIEKLKISEKSPRELLNNLDTLARRFFKETFNVEKNIDYSEMIKIFKEKKRDEIISFCERLLHSLYSGEAPEKRTVDNLISDFEFIYSEEYPQIVSIPGLNDQIQQKEAERIAKELASIKESDVLDSYQNFQQRFEKIYSEIKNQNNKDALNRLEKYRKSLIKRVQEYQQDKFKIIDLSEEISRGERILDLLSK